MPSVPAVLKSLCPALELVMLLKRDLDDGEAEASASGMEQRADIIFL